MENLNIYIKHLNNIGQKDIAIISTQQPPADYHALLNQIQKLLEPVISREFDNKKIFLESNRQLIPLDIDSLTQHSKNNEATIYYIDIIALNNAKHLPLKCKAKNGGNIIFDIFPKERPHRYLPHVMASCCGETIRIEFKDKANILGKQHFSGNNASNEKLAIRFVDQNREYFMSAWKHIVEAQYE